MLASRGGQVPNGTNVKKVQLKFDSTSSYNQIQRRKTSPFRPNKLSVCLSCSLIEIAAALGCQLQRVCDYSDHFHNDGAWMCCHSGTFN